MTAPKYEFPKVPPEPDFPGLPGDRQNMARYVCLPTGEEPYDLNKKVTRAVQPLIPTAGAISLANVIVSVPSGERFFAIDYYMQPEAWVEQIERGAAMLGLLSARIEGDQFILSDGRTIPVSDCRSERIEGLSKGLAKLNDQ
jgi:hypothetical protein